MRRGVFHWPGTSASQSIESMICNLEAHALLRDAVGVVSILVMVVDKSCMEAKILMEDEQKSQRSMMLIGECKAKRER